MTECDEWEGYCNDSGYGMIWLGSETNGTGKQYRSHRIVWQQTYGRIPDGLVVRHRCDNPSCIRLEHLSVGTHADNVADKVRRGRSGNQYEGITHCKRGHEFTSENTYIRPDGGRQCRTCHRAQVKAYTLRKKEQSA